MSATPESSLVETLRAVMARAIYGYSAWRMMQARAPLQVLVDQAEMAHHDVRAAEEPVEVDSVEELIVGALTVFARDIARANGDVIRHGCIGSAFQIAYSLFEAHAAASKKSTGAKCRFGPLVGGEPFSRVLWAARSAFAHQDEWQRKGAAAHTLGLEAQTILRSVGIADPTTANAHDIYLAISGGSLDEFVRRTLAAMNSLSEEAIGTIAIPSLQPMLRAVVMIRLFISLFGVKLGPSAFLTEKTLSFPLASGETVALDFAEALVGTGVTAGAQAAFAIRWLAVKRLHADVARPFTEFESRLESWWKQFEVLNQTEIESPRYVEDLAIVCSRVDQLASIVRSLPSSLALLSVQEDIKTEVAARQLVDDILQEYKKPEPRDPSKPIDLTALFDPNSEIFGQSAVVDGTAISTPEMPDFTL